MSRRSRNAAGARTGPVLFEAVWAATAGFLPVFLVGAVAAVVRAEVPLSTRQLGWVTGVFFATGALVAAPVGRAVQRSGPRRGMTAGAAASGLVLLAIGALVRSWWHLLALLALAGVANMVCSISADLAIAQAVRGDRRGFGFGVKTSCLPLATLLGGLAVPVLAVRAGWRVVFVVGAAVAAAQVLYALTRPDTPGLAPEAPARGAQDLPVRHLAVVGTISGLAVGVTNALGAFYVDAGVANGLSPAAAGVWLSLGSVLAVAARIAGGVVADTRRPPHYPLVAVAWVVGAAGCLLLALPGGPAVLALATCLAFIGGSGWTGLFSHSIIVGADTPATASGIAMVGTFAGGVLGPAWFGAVAEAAGHRAAWATTAGALLVAAALLVAVWTGRLRWAGIGPTPNAPSSLSLPGAPHRAAPPAGARGWLRRQRKSRTSAG